MSACERFRPHAARMPSSCAIIAIDGGGTSTRFLACDENLNVIARVESGSSSHKAVGAAAAANSLREGMTALAQSGAQSARVAVFGLSGSDTPRDFDIQRGILSEFRGIAPVFALCNDALLPLFSAGVREGTALVAGTGSIALALARDGRILRCGGWGYRASDEGSGAWMGYEALRHALRCRDGMEDFDPLFEAMLREANLADLNALARWAADEPDPSDVARFARTVLSSPSPLSEDIARQAAWALARLYQGLRRRACEQEFGRAADALVLSGGLFASKPFAALVTRAIESGREREGGRSAAPVRIVQPRRENVFGAAEMGAAILRGDLLPKSASSSEGAADERLIIW